MHKFMLKFFDNVKYFLEFIRILVVFLILILILYWIQNLTNGHWGWMAFFTPFLQLLVNTGNSIWSGSIKLLGAVFEFKYFVALLILLAHVYVLKLLLVINEHFKNIYIDMRYKYKKETEKSFNKQLEKENYNEQKKVSKYYLYILLKSKKLNYMAIPIDIEEQNKILNKFLIQQLGVFPKHIGEGFLYEFSNIENIDKTIEVLFKVLKSDAPVDYIISIDVDLNKGHVENRLIYISSLQNNNKIVVTSEGVWRYNGNAVKKYNTAQIGLFKNQNETYELHEFVDESH